MNQLGGYVWLLLWSSKIFSTAFAFMIIHGKNATDGEVPFQVSLHNQTNGHVCGGVILNEHWVLTAGHCIFMLKLETVVYNSLLLSKGNTVFIEKTYLHPNFSFSRAHNDIGLIRTVTPMKLNQTNAKPIKLPNARDHPNEGNRLIVSGWGYTTTQISTNHLQIVSIPVIDDQKCVKLLKPLKVPFLARQMLCAGEKVDQSKGSCHGDSGGPATVNGVLQGLVSWRHPFCTALPSVYTRVAHYVDWIHQITGLPTM